MYIYFGEMGSYPKCRRKSCIEDRISGLPDENLCHILSFLTTAEAIKTSVLSHRWKNVWACVPSLDLCNNHDSERFVEFVDRLLFVRGSSVIHRLCLKWRGKVEYFPHIDALICTAVRLNVAEFEFFCDVFKAPYVFRGFELPRSLLMCNTLVVLKLTVHYDDITIPPASDCFPSLKFLYVSVYRPRADSMGKLFSCCPVLEDLIINGEFERDSILNFNISAPKLKRLQMLLSIYLPSFDPYLSYKISIKANAPNLEVLELKENFLANYSLNFAKSPNKAAIDVGDLQYPYIVLDSADRIYKLFTGILNVKFLSLSAKFVRDAHARYKLPTFNNLIHLELLLGMCCSWKILKKMLKKSPNLESLVFEKNNECNANHYKDDLVHEWEPPKFVPTCFLTRLKAICILGFQGRVDEMEVAMYLLKHGEVLSKVIINTRDLSAEEEMKIEKKNFNVPKGFKDLSS